jgi:mRNA interferase RelE/StbE
MPESEKAGLSTPSGIFETRQSSKDLTRLGPAGQKRLEAKLCDYICPVLPQNPYFGLNIRRLKNWEPPTWRHRVGEWRFFYEVSEEERTVFIIAADHRKQAYRSP